MPQQQPQGPIDPDAHFRIDDLMRSHGQMAEQIKGLGPGLIAMIRAEVQQAIGDALAQYKREDKAEDRKQMAEMIRAALQREGKQEAPSYVVRRRGSVKEGADGTHMMDITETHEPLRAGEH